MFCGLSFASPQHLITGYNAETILARRFTYAAILADGNLVTNLLSIGQKSPLTGPDPDAPATIGGLVNHGPFEGDASMTRSMFS